MCIYVHVHVLVVYMCEGMHMSSTHACNTHAAQVYHHIAQGTKRVHVFVLTYPECHDLHEDILRPLGGKQVGLPRHADCPLIGSPLARGVTYYPGVHNPWVHCNRNESDCEVFVTTIKVTHTTGSIQFLLSNNNNINNS